MVEIRPNDLRFTTAEAAAFLNDLMGLDLSPEDIAALETRTEGWIAGLQLAALSLQGRHDRKEFVAAFSGSHHYIIDYLVDEVLSRQPEAIQSFLRQTSILDRLSPPLCDAVLETKASRQILHQLEGANLFLVPLDDRRRWYRYHHLFADFLGQRLRESEPERIAELHRRAAGWYEHNGFIPEAVSHALAAGDFEGAARLVEQSARQMLERSELEQLIGLVDELPDEHVRARPWLCVFHAWALRLSGSGLEAVESRLRGAERALEERGELPQGELVAGSTSPEGEATKILGHIAAIRAYQALYREQIPCVIELAHQALEYRPEGDFVRSSIALALGWAYRFSGDLVAASEALGEARAIGLRSGNIYLAVAATCRAAHGLVLGGKLHQAAESYQQALQMTTREDGRRLPVAGYAYVYLGGVHREWNDLETAARYLAEGIDLCARVGYVMDQVVGHVSLARVRWAQGDLDGGRDALLNAERLSQRMKSYVYVRRWVEDGQVRLWLAQGNIDAAARWAQESGLRADDELTFMRELEHIILARVLVALGREQPRDAQINDALDLLARLLNQAEMAGWMGKAIEILVLQALALQVKGDEEEALAALERALTLAEPEGYVRVFVDEGGPMQALLRVAASRGIAPLEAYVSKLLAAFEPGAAPGQLPPVSPLIEPLSQRELEVLRLLATELSGPEIARELTVTLSTVRYHTHNIYGKLSVHHRRAAIRRAKELGLL
jgi:LuxR family maltose regulon positive regulatory protein